MSHRIIPLLFLLILIPLFLFLHSFGLFEPFFKNSLLCFGYRSLYSYGVLALGITVYTYDPSPWCIGITILLPGVECGNLTSLLFLSLYPTSPSIPL